ncbi:MULTISPECIES: response regulator transcription factor [Campylobacterales]|uniref:DNA-binding response regulator n=1 Tax=Helicobacter equorum TaxID=361872 RepID=A0A3D8ISP8_9HELI|nr:MULTISPECIES: response regulator transcription factor [Campylobacterales]MCI6312813.1 response regulator transcription factor [Helicobacter sp.]MCI7075811.1 response regulator transcription factor [Campylobacter sp.]MCI7711208.1 response regulator transcription factor [Helicobacter sp.]MDD7346784.1 response regulator transcription factor [Helicobacter sp.]RDU68053.1 DNA-binding response regulator [Helicobacter equorum]
MTKIIIIDNEKDVLKLLKHHFKAEDYEVTCFKSCTGILKECQNADLLLIDIDLIAENGLDFIKNIREEGIEIGIIVISAKCEQSDKINGFLSGADDYIAKPFDIIELKARIKAVLRRIQGIKNELNFKNIYMDLSQNKVRVKKKNIKLSALEFRILAHFLSNKKRLIERYELASEVWGDDSVKDKAINIAISRLKRKLGKSGKALDAVRGQGYILC